MAGIELFHEDGKSAGVFYCSECRIVHKTKGEADACHGERLCACGKPCERYDSDCRECRDKRWRDNHDKKEAERFAKAKKVTDYDGFVFDGDRYFPSIDEYIDHLEDDEVLRSEYVWACKNVGIRKASVEDITQNICENMWEEADENDLKGIAELQVAIDKFNEANKSVEVWEVDYSTAVLVHVPAADANK